VIGRIARQKLSACLRTRDWRAGQRHPAAIRACRWVQIRAPGCRARFGATCPRVNATGAECQPPGIPQYPPPQSPRPLAVVAPQRVPCSRCRIGVVVDVGIQSSSAARCSVVRSSLNGAAPTLPPPTPAHGRRQQRAATQTATGVVTLGDGLSQGVNLSPVSCSAVDGGGLSDTLGDRISADS
jgi:hypothetical protein